MIFANFKSNFLLRSHKQIERLYFNYNDLNFGEINLIHVKIQICIKNTIGAPALRLHKCIFNGIVKKSEI